MKKIFFIGIAIFLLNSCAEMTPLVMATKQGDTQTMQSLIKAGANINEPSNRWIPIFWAINSGVDEQKIIEMTKLLIEKGTDINSRDDYGYTPLHWAVYNKNNEVVKFLITKGADFKIKTKDGQTPLGLAIANDYGDTIKILNAAMGNNSNPIRIGVIADACILRKTIDDTPSYVLLDDSASAQKHMSDATKRQLEKIESKVFIPEFPEVCSFVSDTNLRVAKNENAPIKTQSSPFYINDGRIVNHDHHNLIKEVTRYTAASMKPNQKQPLTDINERLMEKLNDLGKQNNLNRVLILVSNGIIIPKSVSIAEGVVTGAVTAALTLGMFTYAHWERSGLTTNALLVDLETRKILWSNSATIIGDGCNEYSFYASGQWYDNFLSNLDNWVQ